MILKARITVLRPHVMEALQGRMVAVKAVNGVQLVEATRVMAANVSSLGTWPTAGSSARCLTCYVMREV